MNEEQQEDQYINSGAPNFETALAVAAQLFGNLSEEAQEEVTVIVVGRYGECTVIGQGENFPSNEEGPQSGGFIIYIDDITNFLDSDDSGEEGDEEEEEEEEEEEGDEDEGEEEGEEEEEEESEEETGDDELELPAPKSPKK